jgi:hypothetical protein
MEMLDRREVSWIGTDQSRHENFSFFIFHFSFFTSHFSRSFFIHYIIFPLLVGTKEKEEHIVVRIQAAQCSSVALLKLISAGPLHISQPLLLFIWGRKFRGKKKKKESQAHGISIHSSCSS